jgi:hypothetical protein
VDASGDQYEGDWRDNVRHGHGTQLSTDDGSIYTGQYIMGIKHGPGSTTYLNGNRFEGNYVLDHSRGVGSYTLNVGTGGEKVKLRVFGY